MKKVVMIVCVVATMLATGCNRGPFRQFFRGSSCNSCQPALGRFWGARENVMSECEGGQCMSDGSAIGTGTMGDGTMETEYSSPAAINSNYVDPYNGNLGNAINPPGTAPLPGPQSRGN